jgi:hypothetical protein
MDCYLVEYSKKGIVKGPTRDLLTMRVSTKAVDERTNENTFKVQVSIGDA